MTAATRSIGETCALIRADIAADVEKFEGAPFTGRTVAEWMGNLSAAVSALAGMVATLDGVLQLATATDKPQVPDCNDRCETCDRILDCCGNCSAGHEQ